MPHYIDKYPLADRTNIYFFCDPNSEKVDIDILICTDCGWASMIATVSDDDEIVYPLCGWGENHKIPYQICEIKA